FADPRTGGPRALDAVQTVLLPGDQVGAIEEVQKLLPGFGPARNSTSSDQNWVKFGGAGIVHECAQLEHGRPCVLGQDPTQRSGCAGTGTFVVTQHQCTQPVTEDCVLGRHDLGRGVGLGVAAGQYPIHGRGAAPNPVAGQVMADRGQGGAKPLVGEVVAFAVGVEAVTCVVTDEGDPILGTWRKTLLLQ